MGEASRRHLRLLLGVAVLLIACGDGGGESCHDARTLKLREISASVGQVSFEADVGMDAGSYAYPVVAPNGSAAPEPETCWASLMANTVVESSDHDFGPTDDLGSTVMFQCMNEAPQLYRNLEIQVSFADARLVTPDAPSVTSAAFCFSCPYVGEPGNGCSHYAEPSVLGEALAAEGIPTQYPEFVSADFERELHVRLDTGRIAEGGQGVCQENVQVTAEATFSVTAARYQAAGITTLCAR